jgi:hypothetical protein
MHTVHTSYPLVHFVNTIKSHRLGGDPLKKLSSETTYFEL